MGGQEGQQRNAGYLQGVGQHVANYTCLQKASPESTSLIFYVVVILRVWFQFCDSKLKYALKLHFFQNTLKIRLNEPILATKSVFLSICAKQKA